MGFVKSDRVQCINEYSLVLDVLVEVLIFGRTGIGARGLLGLFRLGFFVEEPRECTAFVGLLIDDRVEEGSEYIISNRMYLNEDGTHWFQRVTSAARQRGLLWPMRISASVKSGALHAPSVSLHSLTLVNAWRT